MFSLKILNFACIKFRGPVLYQLLICFRSLSRKLKNFNLCECLCACVCVCLCVRAYAYVSINETNQNSVWIATCTTQYTYLSFEMWRNLKSLLTENFKNLSLIYITQICTCLKFCYISSSIKILYTLKQSWKRIFIGIFFKTFMPNGN